MERKMSEADVPIMEEIIIPKHRFDEINSRYKALRNEHLLLEQEAKKKEKIIKNLESQIEDIKSGYEKALNILRVKEIFVSGGLTEEQYKDLVEIISKTDDNDMIELANRISKLIKNIKGD